MDKEQLKSFLDQNYELLNNLDKELIQLGKNPDARLLLDSIHSYFSTIIDNSKQYNFNKLISMAVIGERLVGNLRNSEYNISNELITILLKLSFSLREIIFSLDEKGEEPDTINSSMVSDIEEVIKKQESGEEFIVASTDEDLEDLSRRGSAAEIPVAFASFFTEDELMDGLMNLVLSLMYTQVQVREIASQDKKSELESVARKQSLILKEMYSRVHKAKVKPLSTLLVNFDKVVSDIATSQEKKVQIMIDGENKELDIRTLDVLRNSLIHIIKNAIEHGIESPADRDLAGKSPQGEIHMSAYHHGELFYLKIKDDGSGIDPAKIRKKIIEKNLLLTEEANELSDKEAIDFIFEQGISNSKSSAGLDVVRNSVEQIAGKFYLFKTTPKRGTEFHLTLPLINSIVPSIILKVQQEKYIITRANIFEVLNSSRDKFATSLQNINGFTVFKLRGELLPVLYLTQVLKYDKETEKDLDSKISILVIEVNYVKYCLVADNIIDTEDIIVRPLTNEIKNVYLFSGVTVLQDDSAALILDVGEIMRAHLKNLDLTLPKEEEVFE